EGDLELDPERARRLASVFSRAYVRQVTVNGVYHADPHRGNVLLADDGRLALLDFGLLGRLDEDTRRTLALLLLALAQNRADDVIAAEAAKALEPNRLLGTAFTQLEPVLSLPRRAGDLLARLEEGKIKVGVQPTGLDDSRHMLASVANRLGAALIIVGLLVSS